MATGWLGWPPDVAWRSTLAEILIAVEARTEWARLTSPFAGSAQSKPNAKTDKPKPIGSFIAAIKKLPGTKYGRAT